MATTVACVNIKNRPLYRLARRRTGSRSGHDEALLGREKSAVVGVFHGPGVQIRPFMGWASSPFSHARRVIEARRGVKCRLIAQRSQSVEWHPGSSCFPGPSA